MAPKKTRLKANVKAPATSKVRCPTPFNALLMAGHPLIRMLRTFESFIKLLQGVQGHVATVVRPTDSAPIGDQQVIEEPARLSRPSPVIEDDATQKSHRAEGHEDNSLPSSSSGIGDEDKQESEEAEDRSLEVPPSSPTKSESAPAPS